MEYSSTVDVGYVDEAEYPWKLDSKFFPSKVGGRPSWLQFTHLPSPKDMECDKCHEACIFLCQVYAPIETRTDCFHRTVFVFMCRNPSCHLINDNAPFIVYRSQLKRENDFYPFDPPEETDNWHPECKVDKWTDLCAACGNSGTSHCGRCKLLKYCSRSHQVCHWKDYHKQTCNSGESIDLLGKSSCLLPEYELIVEPEGDGSMESRGTQVDDSEDENDDDKAEESRIQEFEKLSNEGKTGTLADDESVNADLISMAASVEDKAFNAFKVRIAQNPGQVLRYQRGGNPLLLSEHHIPTEGVVPPCPYCGAKRIFEFQILPQLLNHLSIDNLDQSIDWGILVVYTCERSCSSGPAYKKEFLWKQDVSE